MSAKNINEFLAQIAGFPFGIHCCYVAGEPMPRMVLKGPVNHLLPAHLKQGFKIYVVPVKNGSVASVCLMCAIFDDPDEPLTLLRHLEVDAACEELLCALTEPQVLVHLFDEENHEQLCFQASVHLPETTKSLLVSAKLAELTRQTANSISEQATEWFGVRTESDDNEAINIRFDRSPYEEASVANAIVRDNPGSYQEQDIVRLLRRVFRPEQIYHSPRRIDNKKEIADVIVITDALVLIIQAKDSPNNEASINRRMERKRLASIKMVKEAVSQLRGAVRYIKRSDPLRMIVDGKELTFNVRGDDHVQGHNMLSLAVVRELFNNEYEEYGKALLEFFDDIELPCIALDYTELLRYVTYLPNERAFVKAYLQVSDFLHEHGKFARLRFGIDDARAVLEEDAHEPTPP